MRVRKNYCWGGGKAGSSAFGASVFDPVSLVGISYVGGRGGNSPELLDEDVCADVFVGKVGELPKSPPRLPLVSGVFCDGRFG